ncbi:hypothetical protein CEUSTIGMA_g9405.t1 [Chlamydomonas eustigma]|uniref:Cytochrome b561 domain-containing protein n=1 Tax=Chlamydomonas eustigma TaxID=1157962 RepID=A0A250XFX8_9CHLO|nr:hypothetical protein CEUSTIGMA_g9405.t1 [Chlamydomonas eustigma]|eukprot:GAX81977.1 hypothetical protein CEUSTIGMA_g9405.t1 [Chlamydomonas eustigma]
MMEHLVRVRQQCLNFCVQVAISSSKMSHVSGDHSLNINNVDNATPKLPPIVAKLTLAIHVSTAVISLSLAFLLFDSSLFSWHPLFMSIGYILFMSEGVVSSIMFRHLDGPVRVRAIWTHAVMQARALICVALGFAVIYQNKIIGHKLHFKSTHSKFGVATLLMTVLSPLMGVVSFKRLGIITKFPEKWHSFIKFLHRRVGLITWLLAMITIQLALPHPTVKRTLLTPLWQIGITVLTFLLMMLSSRSQIKLKDDGDRKHSSREVDLDSSNLTHHQQLSKAL